MEGNELKQKNMSDSDYTTNNGYPKKSLRSVGIKPEHIDNKAMFTLDILNRQDVARHYARLKLFKEAITEDDLYYAGINAQQCGLNKLDINCVMDIALENKAFCLEQERIIAESKNNKTEE